MSRYEVYEHITNKFICALLTTDYADAWRTAESHGWYPNNYYIV